MELKRRKTFQDSLMWGPGTGRCHQGMASAVLGAKGAKRDVRLLNGHKKGGSVLWYSHWGEEYGVSLIN